MCGILVINSSECRNYNILESLKEIKHRGPDDTGIFISENFDTYLGHVRLSILDLSSSGHQPMVDLSGRFVISYNGEVYNFLELKKYLEQKHGSINWRSNSDTEVILEGFVREGASFFSKLNGIFALAIYDKIDRLLHVLRDPIGIKPLYFTEQNGCTLFSSEVKGLLSFKNVKRTLRMQSLADQLTFMYVPEPFTMYEEIFKAEPGVHYIFKEGKNLTKKYLFSKLYDPISFSSENDLVEQLRVTFSSSVKRQLISDVPVSLFLSGGLDSSSIAYETVKSGGNIKTAYTISFSKQDNYHDGQSDDLYYAKLISKKLNLDLQVIQAKPEFISLLPQLIPYMEDGISDPAAINTYLICESAREDGVKVMLSGQGADEYLCGYRRYLAEQMIQNMPSVLKRSLSMAYSFLPDAMPGKLNALGRRLKRLSLASRLKERDRLPGYFMWSSPSGIRNIFKNPSAISPGRDLYSFFEDHKSLEVLESMLLADQKFDLRSLNLSYNDKMSMMVGVETRVPFLDFEMVQLMNSIPVNLKVKGNEQKYIFKKAMEPFLPKEIIYRQKAGFALPLRSWFKEKSDIIDEYFDVDKIRKQGIFEPETIKKLLYDQFSGKGDNSYLLFSMLCQQIWLEKQFSI